MTRAEKTLLLALLALAGPGAAARAQEVVAVLSSAPGPYQAALDAFLKEFGRQVPVYRLSRDKPEVGPRTRVVVAFGGEAVLQDYPRSATVIACLAPGISESSRREGPLVFVAMKPPPPVLVKRLKELQPALKRLAVFWNASYTGDYLKQLRRAADAEGVELDAVRVADAAGIPDALRSLAPKPDAIWLAPDPTLITPESFQTIKQFSWDNGVPFYAPTAGLAAAGAAAAVSVSAEQTGRLDAEVARLALSGRPLPEIEFSESTELTINPDSAAKAGLNIPAETLRRADRVLP